MFAPGTVLGGKYRVERILGQGGMGVVVAATHVQLHQLVALKCLLPQAADGHGVRERFMREARASAQLHGEHVCRVTDVGELDDGSPYIVMEMLDGRDLASVLKTDGALRVDVACSYVLQACLGVGEAHRLGIIHRDLKPANLFLTRGADGQPRIKVLDFGIAKAQAEDVTIHLTHTAMVLGSPGYMSPEQLRSSRDVDWRSDIWSLGIVLYELIAGRPPWTGGSITELAFRIAMDPHPPLRALPPGFAAVLDRCLAKDRAGRFVDIATLAQALAPFAGPTGPELASRVARFAGPPPKLASQSDSSVPPTEMTMSSPLAGVPAVTANPHANPSPAAALHMEQATTMTTGSLVLARASSGTRWGIVGGGAAFAIVMGVVLALALSSGSADKAPVGSPSQPPAASAPLPPAAALPAATVPQPVTVTPIAPVDASVPDAEPPDAAPPPPDAAVARPHGRPTPRPQADPEPRDLGAGRR